MTNVDAAFNRLSKRDKDSLARQALARVHAKKEQNQSFRAGKKARNEVRIERWVPRDQVEEVRQLLSLYADARQRREAMWIRVAPSPDGQHSGLVIDDTSQLIRQHPMSMTEPDKRLGTHSGTASLRDLFHMPSYKSELRHLIAEIVAAEGPLPLDVLELKMARRHGYSSRGTRILDRIGACLDGVELHAEPETNGRERPFVWARGTFGPRAPWRGRRDRDLADISRHEWADLLDRNGDELEAAEDPVRAAAALAGVKSLVKSTRELLTAYRDWWQANPSIIDWRNQRQLPADGQGERVVLSEG
ncbi:DUF3320 domain-containing protein [Paracoccus sp. YIM 132242]|uniref:DUF3320 domain-containing protein n=1 Tax=Paracoccus lichenicola TaxID=2665644 RepID=A0A6L6HSF5_9RHOB|nr:DUF3320 domain-containing protein [Paracoccus lichenicola]MTE02097.1 DUF3320 domain-containing protein [Paracoccus lichenicola]